MSLDKCQHCCAPRSEELPMTYICGSEFGGHTRSKMCEYTENAIYKEREDYDKMCDKKNEEIYELQFEVASSRKTHKAFYDEGTESALIGLVGKERERNFERLCRKYEIQDLPPELEM